MSDQPKEKKNYVQPAIVLLLLFILPAGSYYYLNKGYNYQLQSLSELRDYGQIPSFQFQTKQKSITENELKGRVNLMAFLGDDEQVNQAILDQASILHQQFDEQNELQFLLFELDSKAFAQQEVAQKMHAFQVTDPDQVYLLNGDPALMQGFVKRGIRVPQEKNSNQQDSFRFVSSPESVAAYPYLVLADTSNTIRNYYNIQQPRDISRLVEHLALIIPRPPRPDIELRREREK